MRQNANTRLFNTFLRVIFVALFCLRPFFCPKFFPTKQISVVSNEERGEFYFNVNIDKGYLVTLSY